MAKTGTVQNAQAHPLEADGFDKTILLIDDTMKPWFGENHSAAAHLSLNSER